MNLPPRAVSQRSSSQAALTFTPAVVPERRPAELFLESLQHRVYRSVGLTAADCQHREWVGQQTILPARLQQKAAELSPSEFARYRSAVFEALARDESLPRPTIYERPHQYSILRDLKVAVESAAARLSIELPFTPVIGTLPTRVLEPLMLPVPDSDEVVLVVDGTLLTYVHLFAKAVAHALPFELLENDLFVPAPPATGWEQRLDPDGTATQRFVELMMATLAGNPAGAPSYPPHPASEQTTAALCECMELFIVAREYARLCEGEHLVARAERRHAHGETFEALTWTAEQELRADGLGLGFMLTAAHAKGESPRLAFWSADILLASFALIDRTIQALECPVPGSVQPRLPTMFDERRLQLHRLMGMLEGGDRAVAFADAMAPVLATLAERFEIVLHDLHSESPTRH